MDPTKQYLTQYFFFIKLNKMEKEVELMKKVSVSQKIRSQALWILKTCQIKCLLGTEFSDQIIWTDLQHKYKSFIKRCNCRVYGKNLCHKDFHHHLLAVENVLHFSHMIFELLYSHTKNIVSLYMQRKKKI